MIDQTILHYKILEKLGEGGMGVVYKAHDTKLNRAVALKFLPRALTADSSEHERFYHEARSASQIMHPNVTAIFEIGESEGQIYLSMEYVDGRTLKEFILKEEPVSVRKALDIAIQICAGLAAAHEKGIVHRDIKSENILVSGKGDVKITDFGLAKLKGASKLTKVGSTLGTASYMSPEQAQGEDVDARSDIFSTGVVLYELLTGKLPFRGDHQAAILYSLINEDPLPLTRFNERLSPELQRIVSKALERDKEDRYQHADEMLADLRRERKSLEYARTGSVVQQPSSGIPEDVGTAGSSGATAGRRAGKFKGRALIITGSLLILIAGAIYLYFSRTPQNGKMAGATLNKIAVLPFENFGPANEEYFVDGLTDEIRTKLSGLSGLAVIARASSVQYKKTTKSIAEIGNELNVGYLLQGTVRWEEDDSLHAGAKRLLVNPSLVRITDGTQVWSQSFEGKLSGVFEIQSDIAQQVARSLELALNPVEQHNIESRPTNNSEAYDYYLRGQQESEIPSPPNMKQAVAMFRKATDLDPNFAGAYACMCRVYAFLNFSWQPSDSLLALAKTALDKVHQLEPNSYDEYWAEGNYYYYGFRDYDRALQSFTQALQLQPSNADILSSIGYVKRRQGKFQESLDLLAKACNLDPKSWTNWGELGFLEAVMHQYNSADEHFNRARLILGRGDVQLASTHAFAMLEWKGDVKAAREIFDSGVDETKSWTYRQMSCRLYVLAGRISEAREVLVRAVLSEPDIDSASYYLMFGWLCDRSSQHNLAVTYYDTAANLARRNVKLHPDDYESHLNLGNILANLGRKEEAIEEGKKAVQLMPLEKDALQAGPDAIFNLAEIDALVGEYDAAVDNLERLLSVPSYYSVHFIQLDPELASLRSWPRYQKLLEKYKDE